MAEQAKGASPFNETDLADKAAAVTQKHGDQAYQDHQAGREQIRNDPRFENVEAYLERAERKYLSRTLGHEVKPAAELSKGEMASEARELHAHFQQLSERYEQAPPNQRAEIRDEMAPLVNRERELRQEFNGRPAPEITRDQMPQAEMSYSR